MPTVAPVKDPVGVESFDEYYRRDYRQLVGLAYVVTGSHFVAEDVAHDALTEAHRKWDTIAHYEDPGAWVRRVLINKSTSRFRKLRSETRAMVRIGNRPSAIVDPSEPSNEVWEAVRSLPTRQAQAIALFYWEDRQVAEIADILDVSYETAKTHLKRARATLAERLADHRGGTA